MSFQLDNYKQVLRMDFNLSCVTCNVTNCVSPHNEGSELLVLNQLSFIMLQIGLEELCYDESSVQTVRNEVFLERRQKNYGTGHCWLVVFVSLVATAVTAVVTLSKSIQNASVVNELAHNTSMAMKSQEDIDLKLEVKLNALKSVVVQIGYEVEALEKRESLCCHAAYKGICVTNVTDS